jgi:hypothetical protein
MALAMIEMVHICTYLNPSQSLIRVFLDLLVEGGGTRLQACGGHLELRTSGRGRIRQRSKQGRQ